MSSPQNSTRYADSIHEALDELGDYTTSSEVFARMVIEYPELRDDEEALKVYEAAFRAVVVARAWSAGGC